MKNVTCENKRMGAMQFDYAGSTLTFPPGRFVTSEDIALSAESRLSAADFQIIHEETPRRTAAEAIAENPELIGRGDSKPASRKSSTKKAEKKPASTPKPPKIRAPKAPKE